jgi:hypothetical protein
LLNPGFRTPTRAGWRPAEETPVTGATEKERRTQRLAAALRDNLKRRKTQARSRRDETPSGEPASAPGEAAADPSQAPAKGL